MAATATMIPTNLRRRRAAKQVRKLNAKDDAVSKHVGKTITDLYELSQSGTVPVNITFALRLKPDTRSPEEIKESFETFTQAILKLLQDLFCTCGGTCTVDSYVVNLADHIESCVFRYDPTLPSPN
ncbi:TPA: hypothetical protein DD449_03900 [Candidatus Berkelbacteria bacterium]|uniref:Uncharacterized protein n=1 Tax=Berkelbacteria bacterium GW2011_GWE1_39_12 TaxID=1618337 RepID=A0A0G4B5H6_9BACT|nr:MAG: hypothetical protein UT28_C0001G0416 [Berkelbacteria bacterium GW2011_GWE1_39_12]HBO60800.1 hypothetical protein [Candidatus Berkelbacteria bacterium]